MRFKWRERPFFYAALVTSLFIAALNASRISFPLPDEHISREITMEAREVFVGGTVDSQPETRRRSFGGHSTYFILKAERLWDGLDSGGKRVQGRLRVAWDQAQPVATGNVLVLEGKMSDWPGLRNPGGFDAKAYWRGRHVDGSLQVSRKGRYKFLSFRESLAPGVWAVKAKNHLSEALGRDFEPWQASFLQALFLGERSEMDQDFKDLFLKTGTLHILAVSGFNIGFLTTVVWLFLRPFPLGRNVKLSVMLLAVWGYCLLVGWQAPVLRASLMATVLIIGKMAGREPDGLNVLGLAACVILWVDPGQLTDVGFQLSFLAVLGLVLFTPVFIRKPELLPNERRTWGEKVVFYVDELFWVSCICIFFTMPVLVQNFYIVTPYAFLANLVVVPASFLLFLFGSVYFLTFVWVPKFLFFVPWLMRLLMQAMVHVLYFIENLPGSVWVVGHLEPWLASTLFAGLFFLFMDKRIQSRTVRIASMMLLCGCVFCSQFLWRESHRRFEMTVLDVGQGDATYFEFPNGGNLLVDAGGARFSDRGRWDVMPFLRQRGVNSLDAVLISHPQEDHIGGLATVLKEFHVRNIFRSDREYDTQLWRTMQGMMRKERSRIWDVHRGDRILGYPGVDIEVLHPDERAEPAKNLNDDSVVLQIIHSEDRVLMTGDIQEEGMRSLLSSGQDLRSDVLKVPHHGAKWTLTGAAFVEAVGPKVSLISVGRGNPFRHPRPETLSSLGAVTGNRVLRTDLLGAIRLVSDGQGLSLDGPS